MANPNSLYMKKRSTLKETVHHGIWTKCTQLWALNSKHLILKSSSQVTTKLKYLKSYNFALWCVFLYLVKFQIQLMNRSTRKGRKIFENLKKKKKKTLLFSYAYNVCRPYKLVNVFFRNCVLKISGRPVCETNMVSLHSPQVISQCSVK